MKRHRGENKNVISTLESCSRNPVSKISVSGASSIRRFADIQEQPSAIVFPIILDICEEFKLIKKINQVLSVVSIQRTMYKRFRYSNTNRGCVEDK
jgi:hypothetical protein